MGRVSSMNFIENIVMFTGMLILALFGGIFTLLSMAILALAYIAITPYLIVEALCRRVKNETK